MTDASDAPDTAVTDPNVPHQAEPRVASDSLRAYDTEYAQSPGLAEEHPEAIVGAAFVGGLVLAQLLRRLGG